MSKLAAKGDLKGLIKALGYQRDWLVRRQAVEALKAIGDTRAIEALVGALGDSNSTVRDEATEALKTLGVSSVQSLLGTPSDGVSGASDSEADEVRQSGDAQTVQVSPAAPVEPAAPNMAAGRARTFRLFVSSTFNDFELERDTLRERVWPRLEQYCEQRGARFQAVDLRWGVGSEAAADQQTMNICLGEIERCHRVTPRPNFLILVGDHYGWRPLPPQIPAEEFDTVAGHLSNKDRALADEWYELDDNARPALRRLRPRRGKFKRDKVWTTVENRLHPALQKAAEEAGIKEDRARVYRTSATEQEIVAGAPEAGDPDQVVCVLRHFDIDAGRAATAGPAERKRIAQFVDADPAPIDALRAELRARLADRIVGPSDDSEPGAAFNLPWGDQAAQLDYLNLFADRVASQLEASIDAELREPRHRASQLKTPRRPLGADELLDAEGWAHHDFAQDRTRFFVGRQDELARIDSYVDDNQPQPLVVTGGGGTGKSALIGEAVRRTLESHHNAAVVYRFVGATPASSDGGALLASICRELARRLQQPVPLDSDDYANLVADFTALLGRATVARPVVIFIDSLDQLASGSVRGLGWIPSLLPDHVRVILSTRPGETFTPFSSRAELLEIRGLPTVDGEHLLRAWLTDAHRTLQEQQWAHVLEAFEQSDGNPLYLKLAFEEVRHWNSATGGPSEDLAIGVHNLIRNNLLGRLERKHGQVFVSHALGYLASSRYGLAEDELVDVLSTDPDVYRSFLLGSYHLPSDLVQAARGYIAAGRAPVMEIEGSGYRASSAESWLACITKSARDGDATQLDAFLDRILTRPDHPKLPIILWSTLYFDLCFYMAERRVESATLLAFYHDQLREAVGAAFLGDEEGPRRHAALAGLFRRAADPEGDRSWCGANQRGFDELPFHLAQAGQPTEVSCVLGDLAYQNVRCGAGRVHALLSGFDLVQNGRESAHYRFLRKNSQKLTEYPNLLFSLIALEGEETLRHQTAGFAADGSWGHPWIDMSRRQLTDVDRTRHGASLEVLTRFDHDRSCSVDGATLSALSFWVPKLGEVAVLETETMRPHQQFVITAQKRPLLIRCSPRGTLLSLAYDDGEVEVVRIALGEAGALRFETAVRGLRYHLPEVEPPVLWWDGNDLWYQMEEMTLARLRFADDDHPGYEETTWPMPPELGGEISLIVVDSGKLLVAARQHSTTTLAAVVNGRATTLERRARCDIDSYSHDPNSKTSAIAFSDHEVVVYEDGVSLRKIMSITSPDRVSALGCDGKTLVSVTCKGAVHLMDVGTGAATGLLAEGQVWPRTAGFRAERLLPRGPESWECTTNLGVVQLGISPRASLGFGEWKGLYTLPDGNCLAVRSQGPGKQLTLLDFAQDREQVLSEGAANLFATGVDGRGDFLAVHISGWGVFRSAIGEVRHVPALPPMVVSVAGDSVTGFWLAEVGGSVYYFDADHAAVVRQQTTGPYGLPTSGSSVSSGRGYLFWSGVMTAPMSADAQPVVLAFPTDHGVLAAPKTIWFKRAAGQLLCSGFHSARRMLFAVVARDRRVTVIYGSPGQLAADGGKEITLQMAPTDFVQAVPMDGDGMGQLLLLTQRGAVFVVDLDTGKLIASLYPEVPITRLGVPFESRPEVYCSLGSEQIYRIEVRVPA